MKTTSSDTAQAHRPITLLRGGRMTKHKGQAASYAPRSGRVLGGVSAIALGVTVTFGGGAAQAGSCTDSGGGNVVCVGPAVPGADTTQSFSNNGPLTVSTTPGFGLDVSSGGALNLIGEEITFSDARNSTITAGSTGINAHIGAAYSGDLTITTNGSVNGGVTGIYGRQNGSGSLAINTADTRGTAYYGINARNYGGSGSLSITSTGIVQGNFAGIVAVNDGNGPMTISAADVTGTSGNGIFAANDSGDLSITASGTVYGSDNGINATNYGTGAMTIVAADVSGRSFSGIHARNYGTDLSITTTGDVSGRNTGIQAANYGSGTLTITVSGNVRGGRGSAVSAQNGVGQLTVIDLRNGASLSSSSGNALTVKDSDSQVTLRSGSAVSGAVLLSNGKDALTIEGGADISSATLFDGGGGTEDDLTLSGFTGTFDGALFTNWETLNANNGSDLTLNSADTGALQTIQIDSGATITAQNADFTFGGDLQVNVTGQFLAGAAGLGNAVLSGNVLNDGLISLADGQSGDRLTFGADLSGNGTIGLDVNLSTGANDQVFVQGDSAGARQGLQVTKSGSGNGTVHDFTLATVTGASTEGDFQLVNADFVTNDGDQAISDGEIAYVLEYDAAAGEFILTPFGNPSSNSGDPSEVNQNPGGEFLAAGVQQVSDQLTFGSALRRIMSATRQDASEANTVSRALNELTSTTRPLVWVEAQGQRDSYTFDDRDVETNSGGLRFGAGLPLAGVAGGQLIGGLEFGFNSLSTNVTTTLTSADIDTDAYDATLSALWIANSQLYIDGQIRYAYFDSTIRPSGGVGVDTDSRGYGLSVEVGKPFDLQNGLTLVPQAQLMYSDINTDDVINLAGGGQTGSLEDGDTLTARLGLRAERDLVGTSVLYGQVDYYHAFDNKTAVTFARNTIVTARGKNTAALTVGGHMALSARTTLFGEISGETGLGSNSSDYAFGGNVGFEIRF